MTKLKKVENLRALKVLAKDTGNTITNYEGLAKIANAYTEDGSPKDLPVEGLRQYVWKMSVCQLC